MYNETQDIIRMLGELEELQVALTNAADFQCGVECLQLSVEAWGEVFDRSMQFANDVQSQFLDVDAKFATLYKDLLKKGDLEMASMVRTKRVEIGYKVSEDLRFARNKVEEAEYALFEGMTQTDVLREVSKTPWLLLKAA